MTEDGEVPMFILVSKEDEYCWTDRAFIHLDGQSALSKKKTVRRTLYHHNQFSHVLLETAGPVDLDVELKFHLAGREYSIDVRKQELETLSKFYKALIAISEIQVRISLF